MDALGDIGFQFDGGVLGAGEDGVVDRADADSIAQFPKHREVAGLPSWPQSNDSNVGHGVWRSFETRVERVCVRSREIRRRHVERTRFPSHDSTSRDDSQP